MKVLTPTQAIAEWMTRSRWHCALTLLALFSAAGGTGYLASCRELTWVQPPLSIFDLEFVGTRDGAVVLLRRLADDRIDAVKSCVAWDFAFIGAYVVGISTLLAYLARKWALPASAARSGTLALLAAAGLDLIEDICLLALLTHNASAATSELAGPWAGATTTAALAKWTLLLWVAGVLTTGIAQAALWRQATPNAGTRDNTKPGAKHDPAET